MRFTQAPIESCGRQTDFAHEASASAATKSDSCKGAATFSRSMGENRHSEREWMMAMSHSRAEPK